MPEIARLDSSAAGFDVALSRLTAFDATQDAGVEAAVTSIISEIRARASFHSPPR